ncbi:MAG: indole-3-glycerol phosphate synthase TrpC [Dehalococcoidia bacterium]|jgi:indole-3-glycerol phosphate synthase|nr:MAG: indole-3-glycerol phosphate synthase [Chloroflexota bacterium]
MIRKTNTILDKIISDVMIDLNNRKKKLPLKNIMNDCENHNRSIVSLKGRLLNRTIYTPKKAQMSIIGEIKRASPSKGIFNVDIDPIEVADIYTKSGMVGISILTEKDHFLGKLIDMSNCYNSLYDNFKQNRPAILRKDFIVEDYQIYESYLNGADAFLLIVKILSDQQLSQFINLGHQLGIETLVEVQNYEEINRALNAGASLIGINNRDLHTFSETINTTIDLISKIPKNIVCISESGIKEVDDVKMLKKTNVLGMLIGEAFMNKKFSKRVILKKAHSLMLA